MTDIMGENYIETMRLRFAATANPVWAWQAILACSGGVTGAKHGFPEWCLEYLYKSSIAINGLWSHELPADALNQLPAALGFSNPGANAFKNAEADLQASRLAIRHDVELRDLPSHKASDVILETVGINYESLKKRLARGRKIARVPKRDKPKE